MYVGEQKREHKRTQDKDDVDSGGGDQLVANTVQNGRQKRTQDKDDVDRSGGDPHS